MKSILTFLLLISSAFSLFSQSDKFKFGFEYSPNFTNVTSPLPFQNSGFHLAHNAFLKTEFRLIKNLYLTTGLGYLNSREYQQIDLDGQLDIEFIESVRAHHYLVMPVGLKYQFGSFYINPEIGIAYNFDNTSQQTSWLSNGRIIKSRYQDILANRDNNKFTAPVFLTIGNEIDLGTCSILLGVKGYYSLNNIKDLGFRLNHYYGFGVVTGVKF